MLGGVDSYFGYKLRSDKMLPRDLNSSMMVAMDLVNPSPHLPPTHSAILAAVVIPRGFIDGFHGRLVVMWRNSVTTCSG